MNKDMKLRKFTATIIKECLYEFIQPKLDLREL